MDIKLKQNLGRIIRTLEEQGMKPTKIAHSIGYTTTRQLYNSIEGQSMLSTKAIKGLIENLNVNPLYLFLGKGEMFLTDGSEIETVRREYQELLQKHSEAVKTVLALNDIIMKLEKRNNDLIELSSAAIKYHQGQKNDGNNKVEEDSEKKEDILFPWSNYMDNASPEFNKLFNPFSESKLKQIVDSIIKENVESEKKEELTKK